ncbi:hypothetical protein HDU98_006441 [Podochytrium sp. JEL0797]|nr:hypothetical protein HDU98_006441 [Podochytrium sp. JEL0797]
MQFESCSKCPTATGSQTAIDLQRCSACKLLAQITAGEGQWLRHRRLSNSVATVNPVEAIRVLLKATPDRRLVPEIAKTSIATFIRSLHTASEDLPASNAPLTFMLDPSTSTSTPSRNRTLEESAESNTRGKRQKTNLAPYLEVLEKHFSAGVRAGKKAGAEAVADQLELPPGVVNGWFQRKAKASSSCESAPPRSLPLPPPQLLPTFLEPALETATLPDMNTGPILMRKVRDVTVRDILAADRTSGTDLPPGKLRGVDVIRHRISTATDEQRDAAEKLAERMNTEKSHHATPLNWGKELEAALKKWSQCAENCHSLGCNIYATAFAAGLENPIRVQILGPVAEKLANLFDDAVPITSKWVSAKSLVSMDKFDLSVGQSVDEQALRVEVRDHVYRKFTAKLDADSQAHPKSAKFPFKNFGSTLWPYSVAGWPAGVKFVSTSNLFKDQLLRVKSVFAGIHFLSCSTGVAGCGFSMEGLAVQMKAAKEQRMERQAHGELPSDEELEHQRREQALENRTIEAAAGLAAGWEDEISEDKWAGTGISVDQCVLGLNDGFYEPYHVVDYSVHTNLFTLSPAHGRDEIDPCPRSSFFSPFESGFGDCDLNPIFKEPEALTPSLRFQFKEVVPLIQEILDGKRLSELLGAYKRGGSKAIETLLANGSRTNTSFSRGIQLRLNDDQSQELQTILYKALEIPIGFVEADQGFGFRIQKERLIDAVLEQEAVMFVNEERQKIESATREEQDLVWIDNSTRAKSDWEHSVLLKRYMLDQKKK